MAADSLAALKVDFAVMQRNDAQLPFELCFLAGVCQATTGLNAHVLGQFLGILQQAKLAGDLQEDEFFDVCFCVKQGRLGDAKAALDRFSRVRQSPMYAQEGNNEFDAFAERQEAARRLEAERRSEQFARELQAKYSKEIEDQIVCQDCRLPVQDIEPVQACGHIFHPMCLLKTVSAKIKEGVCPITCPALNCEAHIQFGEVRALPANLISFAQVIKQANEFLCIRPDSLITCPSPHCSNRVVKPPGKEFHCAGCRMAYCLRCRGPIHKGSDCEQVKPHLSPTDLNNMLEAVKMGMQLKACPNCQLWNPKIERQLKIKCLCGLAFCSSCGARGTCQCKSLS